MQITIDGINIKKAKSTGKKLRLTISPRTGEPVIHIPKNYSELQAEVFLKENINWIKKHRDKINEKIKTNAEKNILSEGKNISLWGIYYKLKIIKKGLRSSYDVDDNFIYLNEGIKADKKKRQSILNKLYKKELEIFIDEILPFWEKKINETPSQIKFRDMKSKWGTCNSCTGIITLNIKLAAFPCECAEMVLVHEFVHFKERLHNARFKKYMTKYLPDWKERVKLLYSNF